MEKPIECDDAISRQAVIDAMSDTWKHICYVARRRKPTKGEEAVYAVMVGTVKSLLPVTQKSGKWEYVPQDEGWYICSECRCGNDYADNFCPQCGARMESEEV